MKAVLAILTLLLVVDVKADASLLITVEQVGGDVVATGTGTANLAALSFLTTVPSLTPSFYPPTAVLRIGSTEDVDYYTGITGPTSFGLGVPGNPSAASGDLFGVAGNAHVLYIPHGYTSGNLASTAVFSGATLASLGVNPGAYVFTWGSGQTADSLTVQIGPAAVPEPSSGLVFGAAIFAIGYCARRRRFSAPA